ncbi:MAG: RNA polymerase sigma factor [Bacteroidia bacterium]|nr:RNA polymerase sigma factor [Bacteroidia bacterium]
MSNKTRINRCLQGDKIAFREFYDLYSRAMLNASLRIVGNIEEAEDILQESFIISFQKLNEIRSDAEFGGYLKRVVVNRSIDLIRKNKPDFSSLDEVQIAGETENDQDLKYDPAVLTECIAELPSGFRIVLTLYLFENYSHRDIAQFLNISEGTSKSQYNRARHKLAELYHKKTMTHA